MTDNDIIYAVIFTTLIILLLIAGVAITIFIANKQRTVQEIKMTQMQLDYEKELRTVQNEVQEQVLNNVSRELHDNIGQILTVMHLQIEQKKLMKPETSEMLIPIHDTLESAIRQVSLLGRSLNSDLLEQNGLLNMMQMEADRLRQFSHFALHWENDGIEPTLNKDQRLMSFRIFQELLNNALKHAQARNIRVCMNGRDRFVLTVQDDGNGFDVEKTMSGSKGAGLRNIMKRATLANLSFDFISASSVGSKFILEQIPRS